MSNLKRFISIQWTNLLLFLSISILPLFIITLFIIQINYSTLEEQSIESYSSMINELTLNLDYLYSRYQIELSEFTSLNQFLEIIRSVNIQTVWDELFMYTKMTSSSPASLEENLFFKSLSGINGDICIVETDRPSPLTGESWNIRFFTKKDILIDYHKLINDPLYLEIKDHPEKKMSFGALQDGVVHGYHNDNFAAVIYPYETSANKVTKFILVILGREIFYDLYKRYQNLNYGSLFFLDSSDEVIHSNHPVIDPDIRWEQDKNRYVSGNSNSGYRNDWLNQSLVEPSFLKSSRIREMIDPLYYHQMEEQTNGYQHEEIIYQNKKFQVFSAISVSTRIKVVYLKPLRLIHQPIDRLIWISVFFMVFIGILVTLLNLIASRAITRPIRYLSEIAKENADGGFHLASVTSNNEIGQLAASFNTMVSSIRADQENLEQIINERTRQIRQSNEKLKSLDLLKNDFIANITHDFRSPLSIIMSHSDPDINQDDSSRALSGRLDTIYHASWRLKSKIDKLLDLAKMDATGLKLNVTRVDIKSFIQDLCDFYRKSLSDGKIIIESFFSSNDIGDFYTDQDRLAEVIDNLIINAIKFVDKEFGWICVRVMDDSDSVRITVQDNGIGIAADQINRLFNRFEQGEGMNLLYKGYGIGLSYAKELVKYLKGDILVESEGIGKGSAFIIRLKKGTSQFQESEIIKQESYPLIRDHSKHLIQLELKDSEKGLKKYLTDINKDNEFDPYKSIVLIVEDDPDLSAILEEFLIKNHFCNIITAYDGMNALDSCSSYLPDLVLCDITLPRMRGDQFHDEFLKLSGTASIPFIFMTSMENKEVSIERKKKGAVAFIQKPFDMKELLVTIESNLNRYMDYKKTLSMAIYDDLTQLFNRKEILRRLREELSEREYQDLSLIFFDIDHFKNINDTYGHEFGDQVLKKVGILIKQSIRQNDYSGRYGGEEFMLVLPRMDSAQSIQIVIKLMDQFKNNPLDINGHKLFITASFGIISLIANEGFFSEKLNVHHIHELFTHGERYKDQIQDKKIQLATLMIRYADEAMYKAKKTSCLVCGFESEKIAYFENGICSNCSSNKLDIGRNRYKVFINNKMI